MVKSSGTNLLKRKYFYRQKLKFYGAPLKSGGAVAPIAPPFPPPMSFAFGCTVFGGMKAWQQKEV